MRRCGCGPLLGVCAAAFSARAAVVEVGSLTTVTVEAPLYDSTLSAAGGCDPAGCSGDKTRDGDTASVNSRWSCKPALGTDGAPCSITYSLADSQNIESLSIAMYKGDTRTRTMDIYVDDVLQTSWTSSGTTVDFETVDVGVSGQAIEVRGVLGDWDWLSIMEVEIMVDDGEDGNSDAMAVEAGTLGTVTARAALYDTNLAISNGCDPDGCTAALTRDGDESAASRWSCAPSLGGECSISYDLGAARDLSELRLATYKGDERQRAIEVYIDGVLVITWTSSGTTLDFESIDLVGSSGQEITITGVLGNTEWLSITETQIMVLAGDVMSPPATPTTTPSSVSTAPTASEPVGELQAVGLIPLAEGDGTDDERYALKDGDLSTFWTCTGDPTEPDDDGIVYYECEIDIDLVYFRHLKQVKIALAEGSVRDMRIGGRYRSKIAEEFVTGPGTTDLETYDFDYSATSIWISAVFTSPGQTIAISEVEFVEEVINGEVLIGAFGTPDDYVLGRLYAAELKHDEPTTDLFEWTSDSAEAIGLTLGFDFSGYFEDVTEMQMQFPVGDTYKFDLSVSNRLDDTDEPYVTIPDLESTDMAGWQSFDLTSFVTDLTTSVTITVKGTGSGANGFKLLNARFFGTQIGNPTDTIYVTTTRILYWDGFGYPDFVGEGTGDQKAIMGAICAVKKASFDGVDCVGGDDTATGVVDLSHGSYYVDGNIFMKSGVYLEGYFTDDGHPTTTDIYLEEGAAGKTDVDAILVMDGIQDAWVQDLFIQGLYDPETGNDSPALSGLGSSCLSVVGSTNITVEDVDIRFCDGDAEVVRDSTTVNIDAGRYDEEYLPWTIGRSRGTGLIVDNSENIWVRRHTIYDNGVAGLHIMNSNNFTFEATIDSSDGAEGEGNVGTLDGQQPIEVIIENSSLVKFQDMRVQSVNDPVLTISTSTAVSFTNTGLSSVETGTCVIQTDALSEVTIDAAEDELSLESNCYVKVDTST